MPHFYKYVHLLRPSQWYKNLIIPAVGLFTFQIFPPHIYFFLILGCFCACGVSSANYILNDIKDVEYDKLHPLKRQRPLASGEVSKKKANLLIIFILLSSLISSVLLNFWFFIFMLLFFFLSQAYTFFLKRLIFIDVITISLLFILRAFAGYFLLTSFITVSYPTPLWGLWAIFLLALFLALVKRKIDYQFLTTKNEGLLPQNLSIYPPKLLDFLLFLISGVFLIGFYFYVILTDTTDGYLFLTIPPATYLLFRFLYLIYEIPSRFIKEGFFIKDAGMVGGSTIVFIIFLLVKYLESYGFL
ncbi:MAG: UbiA family prenyltransferase [Candidatus Helarchaeota archaeon]